MVRRRLENSCSKKALKTKKRMRIFTAAVLASCIMFTGVSGYAAEERITSNKNGATIGSNTDIKEFTNLSVNNDNGAAIKYSNASWTLGDVYANFTENTIGTANERKGGAIFNQGKIGNITGNFDKNTATTTNNNVYGGAIYNEGTLGNLNGDFITNGITTNIAKYAYGGAIYNKKTVGDINGSFVGNSATSGSDTTKGGAVQGGAIWNSNAGTIGNITATEVNNNTVVSKIVANDGGIAQGGFIFNSNGTIGNITVTNDITSGSAEGKTAYGGLISNNGNTSVIGNISVPNVSGVYALAATGSAEGGVIYNYNNTASGVASIGLISGNFKNNYVESSAGSVNGGAISNLGKTITSSTIDSIVGNFEGNKALVTGGSGKVAYGGAIYNTGSILGLADSSGTVIGIKGIFKDNQAESQSTGSANAYGGAIYNSGSIYNIVSDNFENNSAVSLNKHVQGGAIWNQGTIGSDTVQGLNVTEFKGNRAEAKNTTTGDAYGGAIYNNTVNAIISGDIDANFDSNSAISAGGSAYGGSIYNALGTMGNINGAIANSSVSAKTNAQGGAIWNSGNMGDISGNITDTIIESAEGKVVGGVIYNKGNAGDVSGSISNTKVTGVNVDGGVIYNDTSKTMGNISADISDITINATTKVAGGVVFNKGVIGNVSGNISNTNIIAESVDGGIIDNTGKMGNVAIDKINNLSVTASKNINGVYVLNTGTIDSISDLDFDGVTVKTESGTITGLVNNKGVIDNSEVKIEAHNLVFDTKDGTYNSTASVKGGAFINSGTLNKVSGKIYDNISTSNLNEGYGVGMVNGGAIKELAIDFTNNVSNSKSQGAALYNTGSVNIASGTKFTYNKITNNVTYSYSMGGAIYNSASGNLHDINNITFEGNGLSSNRGTTQGGAIASIGIIESIKNTSFINNFNENKLLIASITHVNSPNARGGAVYNKGTITSVADSVFVGNTATSDYGLVQGGAIYNEKNITDGLLNNVYEKNVVESKSEYSENDVKEELIKIGTIDNNRVFICNVDETDYDKKGKFGGTGAYGGAINNGSNEWGTLKMEGVIEGGITGTFEENGAKANAANAMGGAIFNGNIIQDGDINATFIGNYVDTSSGNARGGAIANGMNADIEEYTSGEIGSNITGTFKENFAKTETGNAQGGAIFNGTIISGEIKKDAVFDGNYAKATSTGNAQGGTIYNSGIIKSDITSKITNTYVEAGNNAQGGAIYNSGEMGTIQGDFTGIYAKAGSGNAQGGVIYNDGTITSIYNSNFISNKAKSESGNAQGGAIYTSKNLTIVADGAQSVFKDNHSLGTTGTDNAIYVGSKEATLTFSLKNHGEFYMHDAIDGESQDEDNSYKVRIEGDGIDTTTFHMYNDILNSDLHLANTTIDTRDFNADTIKGEPHVYTINKLTIEQDTNFIADVDLKEHKMDRFLTTDGIKKEGINNYGDHKGNLIVTGMNLVSDTPDKKGYVFFAEPGLQDAVVSQVGDLPDNYQKLAYTPIYKYRVSYETNKKYDGENFGGYFVFDRGGEDEFNPAVLASGVNAQTGVLGTMNAVYDYMFEHLEGFMPLPYKERLAILEQAKTRESREVNPREDRYMFDKALFVRPYTNFQHVSLKNGPANLTVRNHGTFIGGDGVMKESKNNWWSVPTYYVGYNNSKQKYEGVTTKSSGGVLGFTETFYRKNFFTAITASLGASLAKSDTMYGRENFRTCMAGIASKTGYNLESKNGRYTVQPIWLMSYTWMKTRDYTNGAGVKIHSTPAGVFQIKPGIKFMSNSTKRWEPNGLSYENKHWQPYGQVNGVWTIGNHGKVMADDVILPSMTTKPYGEFSLGIQRSYDDKNVAFFEATLRTGKRKGFEFRLGVHW